LERKGAVDEDTKGGDGVVATKAWLVGAVAARRKTAAAENLMAT
jgi:hypothetical protein